LISLRVDDKKRLRGERGKFRATSKPECGSRDNDWPRKELITVEAESLVLQVTGRGEGEVDRVAGMYRGGGIRFQFRTFKCFRFPETETEEIRNKRKLKGLLTGELPRQ